MLELFYKIHSQFNLRMIFFKKSPRLTGQAQPRIFTFHSEPESDAGSFAKQNERWVFEFRASSLVKGFENPAQLGLPKHKPAALSVPIRAIRGWGMLLLEWVDNRYPESVEIFCISGGEREAELQSSGCNKGVYDWKSAFAELMEEHVRLKKSLGEV